MERSRIVSNRKILSYLNVCCLYTGRGPSSTFGTHSKLLTLLDLWNGLVPKGGLEPPLSLLLKSGVIRVLLRIVNPSVRPLSPLSQLIDLKLALIGHSILPSTQGILTIELLGLDCLLAFQILVLD